MSAALRALLSGVIDYAGLFPPAQLPLDQAIRNYARYRTEPESWMLGRFIIPAVRLAELEPYVEELFVSGPPLTISALGKGGNDPKAFLAGIRVDLDCITAFRERHRTQARVDSFEIRLPWDEMYTEIPSAVPRLLLDVADISTPQKHGLTMFYEEAPQAEHWQMVNITDAGTGILLDRCRPMGIKLRCGGLEAAAFPSPADVAATIDCCRKARMLLKFTAGLHHPIRHFNPGVQTKMHGFLNVFVAGVLAHARRLSEDQLRPILEDEDASHFAFAQDGLRWKDHHATVDEITTARRELVTSFGSCSFDEPRDDLRALGLLT